MAEEKHPGNYQLGDEVVVDGIRYVVNGQMVENSGALVVFVLTPIPDGMTAYDLGRKFNGAIVMFCVARQPEPGTVAPTTGTVQ